MAFVLFFFNIVFIGNGCGPCRLPFLILRAQPFAALCLVGESGPGSLGPAATLAHEVERCRFRLRPRLFGAVEEELQV